MGALATAPRTFMWLKDNSTLTYCSDYWCPGDISFTNNLSNNLFVFYTKKKHYLGEPDNSFGNLTYVGDGK